MTVREQIEQFQGSAVTTNMVHIYALIDPETGDIRYIGKSIRPLERLRDHINEPPSNCHRSHWIRSLKARGLEPDMVLLESIDGAWPWQEAERFWIARGRSEGWPLTNNTDGGDGVGGLPEETRARMRATWKGRKHRPESIERLRVARRRRVTSEATKEKMRRAHTGRVITWGAKLGEANRKITPEQELEIRARLANGETVTALALEYGVHRTSLSKVKKGTYRGR